MAWMEGDWGDVGASSLATDATDSSLCPTLNWSLAELYLSMSCVRVHPGSGPETPRSVSNRRSPCSCAPASTNLEAAICP